MNRDFYSQIRQAQRVLFDQKNILLSSFNGKIQSLSSNRTKNMRKRTRDDLMNLDHKIDIQQYKRQLNCDKHIITDNSKITCNQKINPLVILSFKQLFLKQKSILTSFFQRLKNQHEDDSSLIIELKTYIQKQQQYISLKQNNQEIIILQQILNTIKTFLLFQLNNNKVRHPADEEAKLFLINLLNIPSSYIQQQLCQYTQQIRNIIKDVCQNVKRPVFVYKQSNLWPLSYYIHPLLISTYLFLRKSSNIQVSNEQKRQLLKQLNINNYSRVTYINLTGQQSVQNIYLAKYLSKYVQYISFPLEQNELLRDPNLKQYFYSKSKQIVERWLFNISFKDKNLFKQNKQDQYKQIFYKLLIFPINSIFLSQQISQNIQFFKSAYIKFIFKQILYSQIQQFNPSLLIIDYNGRLQIQNQQFQQIIRELTIISSSKILFHYHQSPKVFKSQTQKLNTIIQQYQSKYSQNSNFYRNKQINCNLLHTFAIFIKVSSCTYSLQPKQPCVIKQKHQNWKILSYFIPLSGIICQNHPLFQKYRSRFNHYKIIQALYSSQQVDSYINIPKYYQLLFTQLLHIINSNLYQKYLNKFKIQTYVSNYYWNTFINYYLILLKIQKQKCQKKILLRFPKYNQDKFDNDQLISFQFQIQIQNQVKNIQINPNNQIIIDHFRKTNCNHIFLFNHIEYKHSTNMSNYVGLINHSTQIQPQTKIRLHPLVIQISSILLKKFQHLCNFNFCATQSSYLFYWPNLYSKIQQAFCLIERRAYIPKITSLIFIATKSNPNILNQIIPINPLYKLIIPRSGCINYQINQSTIYIFGGFYNGQLNYLKYQTDVTILKNTINGIQIYNVPQQFYYQRTKRQQKSVISNFYNDFIRPRSFYQIVPSPYSNSIMLIGGAGQKFMRPYSIINHIGYDILFEGEIIKKIKKVRLNNAIVSNFPGRVKGRLEQQIAVITMAQKRTIYCKKLNSNYPKIYSWFMHQFDKHDQKMITRLQYEYSLAHFNKYQQNCACISILITKNNKGQYRIINKQNQCNLQLFLQLSAETAQKFINMKGNIVPFSYHQNLISVDSSSNFIFAIISIGEYTHNQSILVYCSMNGPKNIKKLYFTQIYRFNQIPHNHIIKAISDEQILLLGDPFLSSSYLIKQQKYGLFYKQHIQNIIKQQLIEQKIIFFIKKQQRQQKQKRVDRYCFFGGKLIQENIYYFQLLYNFIKINQQQNKWSQYIIINIKVHFNLNPCQNIKIIDLVQKTQENIKTTSAIFMLNNLLFQSRIDTNANQILIQPTIMLFQNRPITLPQYQLSKLNTSQNIQYADWINT